MNDDQIERVHKKYIQILICLYNVFRDFNHYHYYFVDRSIAVLPAIKVNSPRNTRDYLVWTTDNEDTMHGMCISDKIQHG